MRPLAVAIIFFLASPARADVPPQGRVRGVVIDEASQRPIAGATAILTPRAPSPHVVAATTDDAGRFLFRELPAGSYSVLVLFGDARRLVDDVAVGKDETVDLRAALPAASEVITIREKKPLPVTQATPIDSTVRKLLPYTDAAIDSNDWAVGWMLLDVSALGQVTAFRFLHRPPRGLDEIAQQEVWRLRFQPARDANGQAVASQLLWRMEWPSYWWYRERVMVPPPADLAPQPGTIEAHGNTLPRGSDVAFVTPTNKARVQMPPCRGTAPLNLDLGNGLGQRRATEFRPGRDGDHPVISSGTASDSGAGIGGKAVYRDCSPPDREEETSEAVVERPR